MELERVIEILEKHQEWRRDQNALLKTEMQSPIEIGTAIDCALSELKKMHLSNVVDSEVELCGKRNCSRPKLNGNVYCSYHYEINFG